jgi:tyrosyl-tRNA synthetase
MTAPANDMYGKLMSLPDHAMRTYFEALTDVQDAELDEYDRKMAARMLNPRDVKRHMAREIVTEFHNATSAQQAEEAFIRQFSERKLPADIPDYHLGEAADIVTFIVNANMATSRNETRNLIRQGGVSIFLQGESGDEQRIADFEYQVPAKDGAIVKVGKRKYVRIRA